ncbi:hypothetical protein JCM11641_008413 [Rhodosporidiobolus odoratus]
MPASPICSREETDTVRRVDNQPSFDAEAPLNSASSRVAVGGDANEEDTQENKSTLESAALSSHAFITSSIPLPDSPAPLPSSGIPFVPYASVLAPTVYEVLPTGREPEPAELPLPVFPPTTLARTTSGTTIGVRRSLPHVGRLPPPVSSGPRRYLIGTIPRWAARVLAVAFVAALFTYTVEFDRASTRQDPQLYGSSPPERTAEDPAAQTTAVFNPYASVSWSQAPAGRFLTAWLHAASRVFGSRILKSA